MPDYPATLPLPSNQFGGNSQTTQARTEMESGRTRQRLRFSTLLDKYNVKFVFTGAEFATFKEFFDVDLVGGSLFFNITLPIDEAAAPVALSLRFVEGKYSHTYKNFDHWEVTGTLEREISQAIPDPATSPVPLWFRSEVSLVSDFTASPLVHKNALFVSTPGTGNQHIITVPAVATAGDQLPVGVKLTGAGSVIIRTEGEEGGGGGEVPSLLTTLLTKLPWALWDASAVVETSGSITQLTDLSGNARHLTDSQATGSRALLDAGTIKTTESVRSFLGALPSGRLPTRFHAFMIFKAGTDLLAEISDTLYTLGAFSGTTNSYGWSASIASGNWTGFGGFGDTAGISCDPNLNASKPVLVEMIYSSAARQDFRVNGFQSARSFTTLADASMSWAGLRLGGGAISGGVVCEEAHFYNLTVFDIVSGNLSRATVDDIVAAYQLAYPDTVIRPRELLA